MKLIFLILIANLTLNGFSQNIHLGPELGFNLIKVQTQDIGNNYQPAWHSGGSFKYDFNNWLSLKTGIYYSQKRQHFTEFDTTLSPIVALIGGGDINGVDFNTYSQTNGRHSLNFVQLPIMASFSYKDFSINLGGYFGFMFNSRTKELKESVTPFVSTVDLSALGQGGGIFGTLLLPPPSESIFKESSNSSGLNAIDFGLKTGLTYTLNNIDLNLSYVLGLKDYRSHISGQKQTNSYFQFSVAYLFDLGKKSNNSRFD